MQTYRYRGHSMSDPAKYRTKDEVTRMREEHDPIEQVRRRLLEQWQVADDELKKIDGKVREIVNEAAEFATHDPEPDPSCTSLWRRASALIPAEQRSPSLVRVLRYSASPAGRRETKSIPWRPTS